VDEPVAFAKVDSDSPGPASVADLLLEVARIEWLALARENETKVDCAAERVLAMRRDVVPFLPEHLVPLGTAVSADELDASAEMVVR
jgi:hypothetical protein